MLGRIYLQQELCQIRNASNVRLGLTNLQQGLRNVTFAMLGLINLYKELRRNACYVRLGLINLQKALENVPLASLGLTNLLKGLRNVTFAMLGLTNRQKGLRNVTFAILGLINRQKGLRNVPLATLVLTNLIEEAPYHALNVIKVPTYLPKGLRQKTNASNARLALPSQLKDHHLVSCVFLVQLRRVLDL